MSGWNAESRTSEMKRYIRRNWKIYVLLMLLTWITTMFVMSFVIQKYLLRMGVIGETPGQYINPFYVVYYCYLRNGIAPIGLLICVVATGLVCYLKYRQDEIAKMYDPRPNCNFLVSQSGTYGTSRIMNEEEKESFEERVVVSDTNKIILGMNDDNSVQVIKDGISIGPHKFVSGASGSWKTSAVFLVDIFQLIKRGESVLATDPKGEIRSKTKILAEKYGYITKELNLINPMVSDGIDFMKLIESYSDARTFTEIIMQNTSGDSLHNEDFWAKGERAAICAGILYVKEASEYEGKRHLSSVYEFLKKDCAEISAKIAVLPPGSLTKKQWAIFQTTSENSQGGIMTGVATRLQILNDDAIARIVDTDDMDITLPGKKKCIYYVIVSDQESTNNLIAALFFSLVFIKLTKEADSHYNQQLEVPVTFELDEMMNIGKIPDFPKKLSTIRSRKMSCTICTQDIGQLKDAYGGSLWANIIGNCDIKVMLGVNDAEISAPYWSKSSGVMTIIDRAEKKQEALGRFSRQDFVDVTERESKREVFLPAEIMQIPNEYQLVFVRGHNVQLIKKFSYFYHPMYEEMETELYTEHEPAWWQDVAKEMQVKPASEYEWFANGIKQLQADRKRIIKEKKEEDKKAKLIESRNAAKRAKNGIAARLTFLEKIKVKKYELADFKYKLYAFLHGIKKSSSVGEEVKSSSTSFEEYDETVESVYGDDTYLVNEDEIIKENNIEKTDIKFIQGKDTNNPNFSKKFETASKHMHLKEKKENETISQSVFEGLVIEEPEFEIPEFEIPESACIETEEPVVNEPKSDEPNGDDIAKSKIERSIQKSLAINVLKKEPVEDESKNSLMKQLLKDIDKQNAIKSNPDNIRKHKELVSVEHKDEEVTISNNTFMDDVLNNIRDKQKLEEAQRERIRKLKSKSSRI